MVTKIQFIMGYSIFLFFLMQLSSMAGQAIVSGISPPDVPSKPTFPNQTGIVGFLNTVLDMIQYLFHNIGYFFKLMGASTTFGIFGAVVLTPFTIVLVWIILELIRGI